MKKRRAPDPRQTDLFTAARPLSGPAAHAGSEAWVSAWVSAILKKDPRSREEIAGAMTAAGGEEVTRWVLDAYASPAKDTHNISFARALVLMSVTADVELIEDAVRRLGGTCLWGDEIHLARLGNLRAQKRQIDEQIRRYEREINPIDRGNER